MDHSTIKKNNDSDEFLLKKNSKRFVLFPILHNDMYQLYKKAESYDKAVSLLIAAKNFAAAAPLMELTSAPKLHLAFAKSREAAKDYVEAVKSYEKDCCTL